MHSNENNKEQKIRRRMFEITVKTVIVNQSNKVLLLKRAEDEIRWAGKYDLPGGGVEEGEALEECAQREIMEELGIEVEIGPILYAFDFEKEYSVDKGDIKLYGKGLRFLAFYKQGEIKLNPREHQAYEWLEMDEAIAKLEGKGFESDKRVAITRAKEFLQMQQALDGWKRALADMDNFKKRMQKQNEDFRQYCTEDFVLELLPVIDNFEMATEHIPAEMEKDNWVQGLMHIKNQLETVLRNRSIEEIETKVGDEIDVNIHEVLKAAEAESQGKVKKVLKKGYKMGGKVIRAAVVEAE